MTDAVSAYRADVVYEVQTEGFGVVAKPLTLWQRLYGSGFLRKAVVVVILATTWQFYAWRLGNPLIVPTFLETVGAYVDQLLGGPLLARALSSLQVLLMGYAVGVVLAAALTSLAIATTPGRDLLELLTAILTPLPAIALLPLALIWFGLGTGSYVFVLVHSVLWPVALNTYAGFRAVSPTLRMVGHTVGLGGLGFIAKILIPAAFPHILTGMKLGWAFAWRTLVAAELVFGVSSSGSAGLGWYIYENKNMLEIANVFAGLFMVTVIGLLIEGIIFRKIEQLTVRRWGMQT
ncbi:MAG: ABC transporter permease [Hyphomicrobiaceae bacterium]|nr:MAG: ABC transporter permease [Hyphomicrobiaceae bacterium]